MVGKPHSPKLLKELRETARQLRIESLRMIYRRGQGHPGAVYPRPISSLLSIFTR